MPYLTPADFRAASLAEHCANLELTDDEASEPRLTAAIARLSAHFDELVDDHFEEQAALALEIDGSGIDRLMLPKRCTAVTTVKTRAADGTLTAQASGAWRLHTSLDSAGARWLSRDAMDWLDIVSRLTVGAVWPVGTHTVQVTGDFGWKVTPADVKRAVAVLVYDHFKPITDLTRRADRWATQDMSFTRSSSAPTGLPEVDDIVALYRRSSLTVA